MSARCARSLASVPAAVLVATVGVVPVLAATTWTVRPGGPISMKSGKFILTDTTTGSALTLSVLRPQRHPEAWQWAAWPGLGSIAAASFTNCSSPFGFGFTLQARDLPWHLNFSSSNATTGVMTGSLSHLQMKLSLPSCTAVIDGTSGTASDGIVKFRYANGTGVLQVRATGGNLHFYNVRGCAGLVVTGDSATISAAFALRPKQAITSP